MIVRLKTQGNRLIKYAVMFWVFKIALIAVFILNSIMPFGGEFLDLLDLQVNGGIYNFRELLLPLGKIILSFVALVIIEIIVVYGFIFPLIKVEINRY